MPSSSLARLPFPSARFVRTAALASLGAASLVAVVWATEPPFADLHRAPAISNVVDGVVFEAGNWTPLLAAGSKGESWGNHRAVVEVEGAAALAPGANVRVVIPWRRRDQNPAGKAIVVVDAATNLRLLPAVANERRLLPEGDL